MKLLTKDGRPTRYGVACGYVETFAHGNFSARLDMPSPSAGVVRVIADGDPWRVLYNGRSLTAARKAFDGYKRGTK